MKRKQANERILWKNGKIQLHIPRSFTDERPAVGFGHRDFNMAIENHALGSKLTSAANHASPQFHAPAVELLPLTLRPGNPRNFKDYSSGDSPALNLYVVTFTNATLVSFSWPHCAWDMSAQKEIIAGWRCVLEDREDEIKTVVDTGRDALLQTAELAESQEQQEFVLQKHLMKPGLKSWLYVARILFEGLKGWNKPRPVVLSVSSAYMKVLREEALATRPGAQRENGELSTKESKSAAPVPFLSDGDILTAWTARLCARAVRRSPRRTVTLLSVFDVRGRAPTVFSKTEAYLQNCVLALHAPLTGQDLTDRGRLGVVAAAMRQAIAEQTPTEQVALHARVMRESLKRVGDMPMFGDSSSYAIIMSSWASAGLFKVDFGKALKTAPSVTEDDNTEPVSSTPVRVHGTVLNLPPVATCWHIVGKDTAGTYWIIGQPRGINLEALKEEFGKITVS
jgi:hypothetical protein